MQEPLRWARRHLPSSDHWALVRCDGSHAQGTTKSLSTWVRGHHVLPACRLVLSTQPAEQACTNKQEAKQVSTEFQELSSNKVNICLRTRPTRRRKRRVLLENVPLPMSRSRDHTERRFIPSRRPAESSLAPSRTAECCSSSWPESDCCLAEHCVDFGGRCT